MIAGLACVLLLSVGMVAAAHADAGSPVVAAVPGAPLVFGHTEFDLGTVGYVQSEVFFEGTAAAYGAETTPLSSDGMWTVEPSDQAAYKSRAVVNRPIDPDDFNGTVLVEWLNVSGGVDAGPDWQHTHVELIRRGYAWIGVSAQAVGVNQLKCPTPPDPSCPSGVGGPTPGDPDRYGTLNHPGDSFSYDIFSQAGQAIRDHADVVLGGLQPEVLIAAGESQSAGRLVTYINAIQPQHHVYDGFFVHSRGSGGAPLRQAPQTPTITPPSPTFMRQDLDVPVVVFQAETDAGGVAARQPDSDGPLEYRLYEVAGTAHFDLYGLAQAGLDMGRRSTVAEWFDSMRHPVSEPLPNFVCSTPINSGPATFVARAAIAHLDDWIRHGTPPPMAPRLETTSLSPVVYARDSNGIARGGVRTPAVDVPVAVLSGFGQSGSPFCSLFGTTVPFSADELTERYRNHGGFVSRWNRATHDALAAGFIVGEDAADLRSVAAMSDVLKK
ncbi:MAG: alpha/beta hydrolase domain-containing protein [Acidimicrobiia bacterium]|nr:alpha/beta hydrolase domain-containing protein [Acidimicrobiia bacterium]MDH5237299.1 alpha/beta hydrolase domain-containing protein [Acidimicrobiia bacterium]